MRMVLASYGNIPTGIGTEARWLWKMLPFSAWIQAKHKKFEKSCGWGEPIPEHGIRGRRIMRYDWHGAAKRADLIVCVERPLPEGMELLIARHKIPLVVLANPEWTRKNSPWLKLAKLVVARTDLCARHLESLGVENVVQRQVAMDLSEFPYRQRTCAQVVRFSNGWGGVHDRKGWPEVLAMLRIEPGCVEVYSQLDLSEYQGPGLVRNTRMVGPVAEPLYIYNGADVMLVPSRFEGVGLAVLEAMASGCIVMATDAEPMSQFIRAAYGELAPLCLLPVERIETALVGGQDWPAHIIDPLAALNMIDRLRRSMKAAELSAAGRAYIEENHGQSAAVKLLETIIK